MPGIDLPKIVRFWCLRFYVLLIFCVARISSRKICTSPKKWDYAPFFWRITETCVIIATRVQTELNFLRRVSTTSVSVSIGKIKWYTIGLCMILGHITSVFMVGLSSKDAAQRAAKLFCLNGRTNWIHELYLWRHYMTILLSYNANKQFALCSLNTDILIPAGFWVKSCWCEVSGWHKKNILHLETTI